MTGCQIRLGVDDDDCDAELALQLLHEGLAHSETSAMIGDRMDTDVLAGLEAGMETFLVLTGLTTPATVDRYPFRPSKVVDSIADLVDCI
jgi:ribonucleotide monophosphatase NagD (HAD superfamily)